MDRLAKARALLNNIKIPPPSDHAPTLQHTESGHLSAAEMLVWIQRQKNILGNAGLNNEVPQATYHCGRCEGSVLNDPPSRLWRFVDQGEANHDQCTFGQGTPEREVYGLHGRKGWADCCHVFAPCSKHALFVATVTYPRSQQIFESWSVGCPLPEMKPGPNDVVAQCVRCPRLLWCSSKGFAALGLPQLLAMADRRFGWRKSLEGKFLCGDCAALGFV